jgi:hypothetical protein
LYSLLSQQDISGKGDDPIPSFLTFQCQIEEDVLFCTASFRALEISNFLRVNLEEIRQSLVEICNALPVIRTIRLHIFAFHAYVRTSAVAALRKPKLDVMPERELMRLLQKGDLPELDLLLGGLKQSTTVLSSKSLTALLGILQMPDACLHAKVQSRHALMESALKKAIAKCDELIASRKGTSRGSQASAKIKAFHTAVDELQKTLLNN